MKSIDRRRLEDLLIDLDKIMLMTAESTNPVIGDIRTKVMSVVGKINTMIYGSPNLYRKKKLSKYDWNYGVITQKQDIASKHMHCYWW